MGEKGKYVIAVKRGHKEEVQPDWVSRISDIDGIELLSNYRNKRITVMSDEKGLILLRDLLPSDLFYIEPLIFHKKNN